MRLRLGEILVREKELTPEHLKEVLEYQRDQGGLLGSILVELGFVPESSVARALAVQSGLPAVCLSRSTIPADVASLLPRPFVRAYRVLPVEIDGARLRVAMADPEDRRVISMAASRARRQIQPSIAVASKLDAAIRRTYGASDPDRALGRPRWILPSEPRCAGADPGALAREATPLIPRAHLFGHAAVSHASLSPDGKTVSFIGASEGRRALSVAPVDDATTATVVANDEDINLHWHVWAPNGRHIIYSGDEQGNECRQLYSVDTTTLRSRHLTGAGRLYREVVQRLKIGESPSYDSRLLSLNSRHPNEVLVEMSAGTDASPRVYRVHVASGRRTPVPARDVGFSDGVHRYWADGNHRIRACLRYGNGRDTVFVRRGTSWRPVAIMRSEGSVDGNIVELEPSGRYLFFLDDSQYPLAHLVRLDLEKGTRKLVATPKYADIETALVDGSEVKGVVEYHPRVALRIFCPELAREFDYLRSVSRGFPMVADRSSEDRRWLVKFIDDRRPPRYFVYDRRLRRAWFLFDSRPELGRYNLAPKQPVTITARDGLRLPCYLTLPLSPTRAPMPMVVLVHGGPAARDYWGFDSEHQWLANRGYAVLSVNYRGSTGFGSRLRDASSWWADPGMMEDVVDATRWAIDKGVAEPGRIAIMGASYGGYLALQGLTLPTDLFACAVDKFGISSLRTTIDERWAVSALGLDRRSVQALLEERSPLFAAEAIQKPLLVAHGTDDVRVPKIESDQITQALACRNKTVTYLVYDGEGHGFYRQESRLSYYAIVEAFLATHLGGRLEPFGSDLENAKLRIPHGARQIPGLEAYLRASRAIADAAATGQSSLDLSGRNLRALPPSIRNLVKLERLHLSENHLTTLPPQIGSLTELEVLDLRGNQIMSLPEEIQSLARLRELDVSDNQLPELPPGLRSLEQLRSVLIDGNPIDEKSLWGFRSRVLRRRRIS